MGAGNNTNNAVSNSGEFNNASEIIEKIVSVSFMTNKWLMWCESNGPDKAVFVPSVFQMRDAFSHMMKIYAKGIEEKDISAGNQDFNTLFTKDYSYKQLEEVFTHSTRAFFDCADYILLFIKDEVEDLNTQNSKSFVDLRSKLISYDEYITELRAAKSDDMKTIYGNIEKWDLLLQVLTSSYTFSDFHIDLLEQVNEIEARLDSIENTFPEEIIKSHSPNFYEKKSALIDLQKLPDEFKEYLNNDNIVSNQVLENSQEWSKKIVLSLQEKIKEAKEYNAYLDGLQKVMVNSNLIHKRKSVFKAVWFIISTVVSWVTTNLLSNFFVSNESTTNADGTATISRDLVDLPNLFVFLIIAALIFGIGLLVEKLLFKAKLKKFRKNN